MQNTVIQFSVQRMVCTGCGSEANASCNCGVAYTPKIVKAAEAIKANPQKSDRAIAADLGVAHTTVRRAREELEHDVPVDDEPRVGRDGKTRRLPTRQADPPPRRGKDAIRERVVEAVAILSGLPPASEVAAYFSGTDTAILISERISQANAWLSEFSNAWENS